jgi:serine/threonine protein kinase
MAAGREPYISKNIIVIMQKHLYDPVPSVREFSPNYSEDFDLLIQKMMAKKKEDRYESPEDLHKDFQQLYQGGHLEITLPAQLPTAPSTKKPVSASRRKPGESTDALKKIGVKQSTPKADSSGISWPWIFIIASLALILIMLIMFLILKSR